MKLAEALALERIKFNLEGNDKEAVIRELVDVAEQSGLLADREQYLDRVLDREFLLSTGLGHGVAVPHAPYRRNPGIDRSQKYRFR